jgi:hypothetical protein
MTKHIDKITITDQKWDVFFTDAHDPELVVDGTYRMGTTWPARYEIYISNEIKGDRLKRILSHELVHALIESSQIVKSESYTEEDLCEFMAIYAKPLAEFVDSLFNKCELITGD